MVGETQRYYDNITSTLDPGLLCQYEAEIKEAEAAQIQDPKAMDIMASTGFKPNPSVSSRSSVEDSPLLSWLQMVLRLEERQFVFVSSPYIFHMMTV
jgi:hypothetical protein